MKLLYIYFQYSALRKKVFRNGIELNFDAEIRFKFENDRLKQTNPLSKLPTGFFSVLPENAEQPVVDSISVIAGGNGVGKTSIVEVLKDIKEENLNISSFTRYIVVYRKHGDEVCLCDSNIPGLCIDSRIVKQDTSRNHFPDNGIRGIPLIYITPHFTPYPVADQVDYTNSFFDLSTSGIMKRVNERYYNPYAEEIRAIHFQDPIAAYRTEQTKWMLSFVSAIRNLPPTKWWPKKYQENGFIKCEPSGIRISISKVVFQKLESKVGLTDALDILEKIKSSGTRFFVNVFYAYAGLYLIDNHGTEHLLDGDLQHGSDYDRNMKQAMSAVLQYGKDLKSLCMGHQDLDESVIKVFFENAENYPTSTHAVEARAFFRSLDNLLKLIPANDIRNAVVTGSSVVSRVIIADYNSEYLQTILSLVDLHFKCKSILPFLDFDTEPRMSSGERCFFDTWGRLYHHFRESVDFTNQYRNGGIEFDINNHNTWPKETGSINRDYIVFFDEAETTIHPDWQRRIVSWTIWFFEAFAPWVHPHIMFATHSPILLSDVPIGNVVLMKKASNNREAIEINEDRRNTFASNIFDLYSDSFFMEHGTMGAFAESKVNELLEKLNLSGDKVSKHIVAGELENDLKLSMLIGDPFISRLIWRRLDALSEDDGDSDFRKALKQMGD